MATARSIISEIFNYCNSAGVDEITSVEGESLEDFLEELSQNGYTGIARHTFKENNVSSSQYFIFNQGELNSIIKEEDISSSSPSYSFLEEPLPYRGALEVFSTKSSRIEKITSRLNGGAATATRKVATPQDITSGEGETEHSREELLRAYKIREPGDDFVESVIGDYRKEKRISSAKTNAALLTIKSSFSKTLGDKKAQKLLDKKVEKLALDRENVTLEDLDSLIDALIEKTYRKMVGEKKAEKYSSKLKEEVREVIA